MWLGAWLIMHYSWLLGTRVPTLLSTSSPCWGRSFPRATGSRAVPKGASGINARPVRALDYTNMDGGRQTEGKKKGPKSVRSLGGQLDVVPQHLRERLPGRVGSGFQRGPALASDLEVALKVAGSPLILVSLRFARPR